MWYQNGQFNDGARTPDPHSLASLHSKDHGIFEKDADLRDGASTPVQVVLNNVSFNKELKEKLQQISFLSEQLDVASMSTKTAGSSPAALEERCLGLPLETVAKIPMMVSRFNIPPPAPHVEPRPVRLPIATIAVASPSGLPAQQVISAGTVGHPVNCAPACKYVKRKGGCKDGAACRNCHQCFWSRDAVATTETEQAPPQPSETFDVSVGTLGHPTRCGAACKYVRRKGGCRSGPDCEQCHLCQWSRSKVEDAQTTPEAPVLNLSELLPDSIYQVPAVLSTKPMTHTYTLSAEWTSTNAHFRSEMRAPMSEIRAPPGLELMDDAGMTASIGSAGHPYSCADACKYVSRSKGCKDGSNCARCHLCRWYRSGVNYDKMNLQSALAASNSSQMKDYVSL
jgi:hypothetical protein